MLSINNLLVMNRSSILGAKARTIAILAIILRRAAVLLVITMIRRSGAARVLVSVILLLIVLFLLVIVFLINVFLFGNVFKRLSLALDINGRCAIGNDILATT